MLDKDDATTRQRKEYVAALIAEIRILIRAIANDPTKRLSNIRVKWREGDNPIEYDYPKVVEKLSALDMTDHAQGLLNRLGILQAIKDELVQQTAPATGLSIAYTALVTGRQRGSNAESMSSLAQVAYGSLVGTARNHNYFIIFLTVLSILMAMFAAWEGTKVSIGKALLQELEPLRAQQTQIAADKFKLEASLDKETADGRVLTASMLPLCSRVLLLRATLPKDSPDIGTTVPLAASPQIREVCGRDDIVSSNFRLVHANFQQYLDFWPDIAGAPYSIIGRWLTPPQKSAPATQTAGQGDAPGPEPGLGDCDQVKGVNAPIVACGDLELTAAPGIQAVSNYTLPFTFGVIGSLLYVLVHHYSNLRLNTLFPRDASLAYLRVILGIVVAACVSLLISAYSGPTVSPLPAASGSSAPSSLVGSLTLSASGITFLAGFGAEAVFTMLEGLVARVFSLPK